jgi:serine/threonine-protein kinase
VYDFGVADGVPFLVMELVEGETLARRIERNGALPLATVVDIMLPVLSAVADIHAAGIIHRDLKPDNILLSTDRFGELCPKVADFGVSRFDDGSPTLTRSGDFLGTYAYLAPELWGACHEATEASDQYALGVVLYECATGTSPFPGLSPFELLLAIAKGPVARPRAINPALPAAFDAVVVRAMSRDPSARFACVEELAEALLPFAGAASAARWTGEFRPSSRTLAPAGQSSHTGSSGPSTRDATASRPWRRLLALLAAAAVGVAATTSPATVARPRNMLDLDPPWSASPTAVAVAHPAAQHS